VLYGGLPAAICGGIKVIKPQQHPVRVNGIVFGATAATDAAAATAAATAASTTAAEFAAAAAAVTTAATTISPATKTTPAVCVTATAALHGDDAPSRACCCMRLGLQ
jgi:hypothetical protein